MIKTTNTYIRELQWYSSCSGAPATLNPAKASPLQSRSCKTNAPSCYNSSVAPLPPLLMVLLPLICQQLLLLLDQLKFSAGCPAAPAEHNAAPQHGPKTQGVCEKTAANQSGPLVYSAAAAATAAKHPSAADRTALLCS
jgi:hypothetical protein